jgi:hypothetical protein
MGANTMTVTAIVPTLTDYKREWPGLEVLVHGQEIRNARDHLEAKFNAIRRVETGHFFFLDDDDDLPADYLSVIDDCLALDKPLVYTDELVTDEDGSERVISSGPYSRDAHYRNAMLVHHLALYRTADAKAAVDSLPVGHFYPEMLLSWAVAFGGVGYVPRVGYIWHRRAGGLNGQGWATLSQVRTMLHLRGTMPA